MKAVIAIDSFKGSLTSREAAAAVEDGLLRAQPGAETVKIPVADGGEGTTEALVDALGGIFSEVRVHGPLGDPVNARYGIVEIGGEGVAVVESAAAIGLPLVPVGLRNPMKTSSFGLGEMILDALSRGCRKFIVGLGGSSTNDAGLGMLSALGYRFFDRDGAILTSISGASIPLVAAIDPSGADEALMGAKFMVACDVNTVFSDAPAVFGPQKGATPEMVKTLAEGMLALVPLIDRATGADIAELPGGGAAGGLGAAFAAFLKADLRRGTELILDAAGFDSALEGADVVITGEGRIDLQTSLGKVPSGVALRTKSASDAIRVIAFCGSLECGFSSSFGEESPFSAIIPVSPAEMPLSLAMDPKIAARNLSEAAYEYFSPKENNVI